MAEDPDVPASAFPSAQAPRIIGTPGSVDAGQSEADGPTPGSALGSALGSTPGPTLGPDAFDFVLPPELIAQAPCPVRAASRMLVLGPLHRGAPATPGSDQVRPWAPPSLHTARELPEVIPPDALVVLNDSRVVAARVHPVRADGRRFELLFSEPRPCGAGDVVSAWVRGAKRLDVGDVLTVGELRLRYVEPDPSDERGRRFVIESGDFLSTLRTVGEVPLPPYVSRPAGPTREDRERYQTVYARHEGSVAAPTAGLHLDEKVLSRLDTVALTLHVGPGTFLPMEVSSVAEHRVPAERVHLGEAEATRIRDAMAAGRPIVAIGTTTTRALEGIVARCGDVQAYEGPIDLVITPGFRFRVVDVLFTNFHLPRSSLLMLVCSFGGRARVLEAYQEAVQRRLRFYSYGDCMLVRRAEQEA